MAATPGQKLATAQKAMREPIELLQIRLEIEAVRMQMLQDGMDESAANVRKVFNGTLLPFGVTIEDTD